MCDRRGSLLAVFVIACAAAIAGVMATPATAFHIPGASYSGNVSGGGTISFSVSSDGSSVVDLALQGPIGRPDCMFSSKQYSQPIPINDNSFNNGEVSGSFPNVQGARGQLRIPVLIPSTCTVSETWSAVTTADPFGSAECQAAQAETKKRKRALSKAKKAGNERKIKKRRAEWLKAKALRDQIC
jgi:hypothetical protein